MKTEIIPPEGEVNMFTVIKSARFRSSSTMHTTDQGESSVVGDTFESDTLVADTVDGKTIMVYHPIKKKWLPTTYNGVLYTSGNVSNPVPTDSPIVLVVAHKADGTTQEFVPKV
jgi:hypothetical protein